MRLCEPAGVVAERLAAAVAVRESDPAWRRRTVFGLLSEVAGRGPGKAAFVTVDTTGREARVSYGELLERSVAVSQGLAGIGVRAGDRVGLWMTNLPEWLYAYFGALRIGAVVVPVSTWLKPREIEYVLAQSGARHLVMLDRFRKIGFPELLAEIVPEWPGSVPGELHSARLPELRNVVLFRRSDPDPRADVHDFGELRAGDAAAAGLADRMAAAVRPSDLAVIKYTSGSTGFPKGVLLEHWGIVTDGELHSRRIAMTRDDRFFSQMPFFHAGGSIWGLMTMLAAGGTLVFTETNDAPTAVRLISETQATAMIAVPPMLHPMVEELQLNPDIAISSLKTTRRQDEQLMGELRHRFGAQFFWTAYGMTEIYGVSALTSPDDPPELQAAGWVRPLDGQEMRVVDPATGQDAEPGSIGEIWMRGLVMRGYHNMPEQTEATINADGWIRSEDLGVVNEQGFIRYLGRLKAMLKVGGENVAVEEIQDVIRGFAQVVEVCVIGVPDSHYGEVPRAYVLAASPASINTDELAGWCRARLAQYKVPRDYVVVGEMPMTGSGKVDRAAIMRQDQEASSLEHIQG
jgi:fatty-acyl-CoA synthase